MDHDVDGPFDSSAGRREHDPLRKAPFEPPHPPPPPAPGRPRPPMPPPMPPPASMVPGWRPHHRPPPVPVPPPPAAARGYLWSIVPLLTFGFGTPFSFLYASVRRNSFQYGATGVGYGLATAAALTLPQTGSAALSVLSGLLFVMIWVGGSVHTLAVRSRVYPAPSPHARGNEHAIQIAKYRRTLREEARLLAEDDPSLAHELGIGRPDRPGTYDDGGLVDVNHAPPPALLQLPGMDHELVDRILRRRDEQGPFFSAEELAMDIELPPASLPQFAEYALFLP